MSKNIEISVFAKRRTTKEGKNFWAYLSRLTKKDGTELPVSVKFKDGEAPDPDDCPLNISIDQSDCSLSAKRYTTEDGEPGLSHTLWVNAWSEGSVFVDHSLDEFF